MYNEWTTDDHKRILGFNEGDLIIMTSEPTESQIHFGGCDDPIKAGVQLNVPYRCEEIEMHSMHTKISIEGFKGKFNSVNFEEYEF